MRGATIAVAPSLVVAMASASRTQVHATCATEREQRGESGGGVADEPVGPMVARPAELVAKTASTARPTPTAPLKPTSAGARQWRQASAASAMVA